MKIESNTNILIVDDQDNWRRALTMLLQQDGYHVISVSSFKEAENILGEKKYDLAILDLRLVDKDVFNIEGVGLLNYIQENFVVFCHNVWIIFRYSSERYE